VDDPENTEIFFEVLRQKIAASGQVMHGDFISVDADGRQFLSEVCLHGHMVCWDCHRKWQAHHSTCPLCRRIMTDCESSRKLEVFRIERQRTVPACLLPGKLDLSMLANGVGNTDSKAFMPLPCRFPGAVRVIFQNNADMTVGGFLWRLHQNMGDTTEPVPLKRTDPSLWRLFVKTWRRHSHPHHVVYKVVPDDFCLLEIPQCIFDLFWLTLEVSMTPEYEFSHCKVEPGFATHDYLLKSGAETADWLQHSSRA